jgi:hypothetical protein
MVVAFYINKAHSGLSPSGEEPEECPVILRASDETEIEIPSNEDIRSRILSGENGIVGIGPGSAFVQRYPHFLVGPVATTSNQPRFGMELLPQSFDTRCTGPMTYVNGVIAVPQGAQMIREWTVKVVAQIIADTESVIALGPTEAFFNQVMHTSININTQTESLPWDTVMNPLIQHVESRSNARRVGNSGRNSSGLRFENCDTLSVFPGILYSFYGDVGSLGVHTKQADVILYPEDYVDIVTGSDGISYCNVHITSSRSNTIGFIGSNILRSVVAHFDSTMGMIGFCDPAV